jgi:hypothetical protein
MNEIRLRLTPQQRIYLRDVVQEWKDKEVAWVHSAKGVYELKSAEERAGAASIVLNALDRSDT